MTNNLNKTQGLEQSMIEAEKIDSPSTVHQIYYESFIRFRVLTKVKMLFDISSSYNNMLIKWFDSHRENDKMYNFKRYGKFLKYWDKMPE